MILRVHHLHTLTLRNRVHSRPMSQGAGRFVHERKMCGRVGNILVVIPRKFIGMWIVLKKEISFKFFELVKERIQ